MIRVLLVDDHAVVRHGLKQLLRFIGLHQKVDVVRDEGGAMSRYHHDIRGRELTLGVLRKLCAGHFSTKLYIRDQSPEIRTG